MGRRKKKRTHVPVTTQQLAAAGEEEKAPKSLVLRKGRTTPEVATLVAELRRLMGPETASRLRERRSNRMKDYAAVAGHLGLTHILSLSQSPASLSLRIARFPRGPTLTFKVERYCLQAHVRATQKRPYESLSAYQTAPLVVLNNFGDAASPPFVKLMKITFQNMFPPLNVNTVRLTDCRRVVLFDYHPETRTVEQRHFAIRAAPAQVNRSIKRLIQTRIPSLGSMTDISEFILGAGAVGGDGGAAATWGGSGAVSDSEVEDEASQVVLPDKFRGRGNLKAQKSAIRLSELGPRLSLRLMKVERGFLEGDVIYHDYIKKAPEEVRALEAKAKAARDLKKRRREEQESNVARKKQKEEEKKQRREEKARIRAERRAAREAAGEGAGDEEEEGEDEEEDSSSEIEDEGYGESEVEE